MSAKSTENGNHRGAAVIDDPARIRNVALVGPPGSGKTTLIEALLEATGEISRRGSIGDGTTVCDHDKAAIAQHRSVAMSVAPISYHDTKINLIDTPGYADFVGELRAGLRADDAALFVVCAAEGVDAATTALWHECAALSMPRAVVIARTDHARADVAAEMAACREALGEGVAALYLPGENPNTLVGLITERCFDYTAGYPPQVVADADELTAGQAAARSSLIEGIIAESEDETLMDRYLDGEHIDEATLIEDLEKAVSRGRFHPMLPVCADTGLGLAELLEVVTQGFPSPLQHALPTVTGVDGTEHPPISTDAHGPLVAEVIRTAADAFLGRVSLVRVFSGTLRPEASVYICGHGLADRGHDDHDTEERITHLHAPLGATLREVPFCVAGDICALTKIGSAETGDTVSAPLDPMLVPAWPIPEPLLPTAIVAHSRSDEDALARNLAKLVAGDPTLRLERNPDTHQLVLWCTGEAHADVVLTRLRAGGTEVDTEEVRVPLRATFLAAAHGKGRHVKQSGGHGQFAICEIDVEPLPRGSGVEFLDKVVGGAIPHQFIPSVEKGVRAQLAQGIDTANPIVDVRIILRDGKAHAVDSSDAAFSTAGSLALKDAAASAGLGVLEPIDTVSIRTSEDHLGAILADLATRHARVLGTDTLPPDHSDPGLHDGTVGGSPDTPGADGAALVVRAEVPAVALTHYAVELRALTSGTARFSRCFARYDGAAH
ncbi:MAG: elongation factor G-like protein EF-G2 [Sciscionella sp.]